MEKIQAGFRFTYKLIIFIVSIVIFFFITNWHYFTTKDSFKRMEKLSKNAAAFTGLICRLFGVKINIINGPAKDKIGLLVGNHMGFIDVIVVNSIAPSLFVTSKEIQKTPLLGFLCEMGGCLFVDRKNRSNIENELSEMITFLKNGFRVILYPEATSTNGEAILPFKRTLLTSAAYANVPIQPYCFNYIKINGEPFTLKYRDSVCWYGDISFATGFYRFACLKEVSVDVHFLDPVHTKPEDDRAQIADKVREMIVEKFKPVIADPI